MPLKVNKMTKDQVDFDTWFYAMCMEILEATGVQFRDEDAVREDYDSGANCYDVAREIVDEYK